MKNLYDVTRRKQLQEAVRNAEETLADALDDTSVLRNDKREIAQLRDNVARAKQALINDKPQRDRLLTPTEARAILDVTNMGWADIEGMNESDHKHYGMTDQWFKVANRAMTKIRARARRK